MTIDNFLLPELDVTPLPPSLVNQPLFFLYIWTGKKGSGVTPLPYSFCQIPRFWGLFIGVDRL